MKELALSMSQHSYEVIEKMGCKIPVGIDLADDISNDPFWKSLEAYMFKFALQDGKYFLCVQEK